MIPAMLRHSSTAAAAPSSAAFPTAEMVPPVRPNATESTTIPVHTHAIAIASHLHPVCPAAPGRAVPLCIEAGREKHA